MTPAYFSDMIVVDERLSKLENKVDKLIKIIIMINEILQLSKEKDINENSRIRPKQSKA